MTRSIAISCLLVGLIVHQNVPYARAPSIDYCVPSRQELAKTTIGELYSIAYNDYSYLAVGSQTSVYSNDLRNWNEVIHNGQVRQMHDVIWDGHAYIAVNGGSISTTRNGIDWYHDRVQLGMNATLDLRSVASLRGQIIAVGTHNYENGVVVTGGFKHGWSTVLDKSGLSPLYSVIQTNDELLIGVYSSKTPVSIRSNDGVKWKKSSSVDQIGASTLASFRNISWNGMHYAGVGLFGDLRVSPDGGSWRRLNPTAENKWDIYRGVAWAGETLIVVGQCGGILRRGIDGQWTRHQSGTRMWLHDVVWTGKRFIAVGGHADPHNSSDAAEGTGIILTSEDGKEWRNITPMSED